MDRMKLLRTQWDRVAAWAAVALGSLALLLGWIGVSGKVLAAEQLPYIISGGLGGLALIAVGVMLWLSADLRDEWTELHALARRLDDAAETAAGDGNTTS
jgi:hypothetical protein